MKTIRIATRSSPLALWQAEHVSRLLKATARVETEIVHVSTHGDRDRKESLASFGGMGVFTKEVQLAVLDGIADVAVHSLKDLPTEATEGLVLAAVPLRASRFDAIVLPVGDRERSDRVIDLSVVAEGARVGTGSPRRRAQLLRLRPDLLVEDVRGNVETRLKKLDEGEYDAILLAEAGLERLGLAHRISIPLRPPMFLPAVGQGALGIECRFDDDATIESLKAINDLEAWTETSAERAALSALRAGCHAPVGAFAILDAAKLRLVVAVLSLDGRDRFDVTVEGAAADPVSVGKDAADAVIVQGAGRVLARE